MMTMFIGHHTENDICGYCHIILELSGLELSKIKQTVSLNE